VSLAGIKSNSARQRQTEEDAVYTALADIVLAVHLSWIVFVAIGTLWTRRRRVLTGFHLLSLVWGITVEAGPWPCPLTLLEQYLETRAGILPYQGGFLLHYLDAIVYPDIPAWLLMAFGIGVCIVNLAIYARRFTTPTEPRQ
jgi:Protein of Unknown function (DUF2784)